MRQCKFILRAWVLPVALIVVGCGLMEEPKSKTAPFGLITTPASYYSTSKARYLGEKYKGNLDRLVERIVRNPKTASLQFANNIASVGGIGFFTHSAATTPDERYLEIVLAAPETFETSGEYSGKVNQLFTLYGIELLSILASDSDIYQEKDVSGYGLNLSWRKVVRESSGPRVTLERAVAYFPKQKVRGFLRQEVSQNDLLEVAVIFALEEDGPMKLVTYRPVEPKPDFRAPIQEQTLASRSVEPKAEAKPATPASLVSQTVQAAQVEEKAGGSQSKPSALVEKTSLSAGEPAPVEKPQQVEVSSSPREKRDPTKLVADKSTSEAIKASEVTEKSSAESLSETSKVNQITMPSAKPTPPKVETAPGLPPSVAETGQGVPGVVPKVDALREQVAADEVAAQSESLLNKTEAVTAKPEIGVKKVETAEAERIVAFNPPSREPAPMTRGSEATQDKVNESKATQPRAPTRSPEVLVPEPAIVAPTTKSEAPVVSSSSITGTLRAKQENVRKTKSQDPVAVEAKTKKTPELDSPPNERTTESKIVASQVEIKAPAISPSAVSKGVRSNDENVSDAKFESPALAKEKGSKASEQPKPFVEKTPGRVIVAPQLETQAAAVSQPPVSKGISSKEEDVGDTASKSSVAVRAEALKAQDQPKVVEDRAPESSTVALRSETKAAAVKQQSPSKVTLAEEEKGSKTEGPSTVIAKTEIARLPEQSASIQEKKLEPPVVVPKSETKPVTAVEPAAPKATAEESLSKAQASSAPVSKAEIVKMSDPVRSVHEKKLEPVIAAPKVEAKAPEATIQNEVAVGQKKRQFASRPELLKEQQPAGIPSPVATAEVKAPTMIQPVEEPAPTAQTQVFDKPASEQIALLAKKPTEIGTEQQLPIAKADVKAPEVIPVPAQPVPAATAKVSEKPANDQIALLTKRPVEVIPEKKPLPGSTSRALEGYIVQLSFSERGEAQRWAEKLTSQGYAVSMTETGNNAFRVRIGNFAVRSEAERRLKTLGQEGLKGIVLNLPQAYRPDTSRAPEATADAISVTP